LRGRWRRLLGKLWVPVFAFCYALTDYRADVTRAEGPFLILTLPSLLTPFTQHPSLHAYRAHLTLLSAHLSLWQHNFKYGRSLLRKLIASFSPADPPATVYAAHLALIAQLASTTTTTTNAPPGPSKETLSALTSLAALAALSKSQHHPQITLLAHVLRLRVLVDNRMWEEVGEALGVCEVGLGVSYSVFGEGEEGEEGEGEEEFSTPTKKHTRSPSNKKRPRPRSHPSHSYPSPSHPTKDEEQEREREEETFITYTHPLEHALAQQVLLLGVVYHTHRGRARAAGERLRHLHALFDWAVCAGGAGGVGAGEGGDGGGYVEVRVYFGYMRWGRKADECIRRLILVKVKDHL
jgi:hypothetical protein